MKLHQGLLIAVLTALAAVFSLPRVTQALTVSGTVEPGIPSGQFMSLTMTIDDTKTRFEMTGPDFSWFAFGFDTTTMQGYALIIQGTDDNRTAVEQNLVAVGDPGSPQATQNINIISTTHDSGLALTTIVIERLNNTGDINDPIFSPSISSLDIIGAYSSFASPAFPIPNLGYHGSNGRGFGTIEFTAVPEPTAVSLAALGAAMLLLRHRRGRQ
jgi:hypothetical protein